MYCKQELTLTTFFAVQHKLALYSQTTIYVRSLGSVFRGQVDTLFSTCSLEQINAYDIALHGYRKRFHTIGGRVPAGFVLSIDQRGKILNLRLAPYETQV